MANIFFRLSLLSSVIALAGSASAAYRYSIYWPQAYAGVTFTTNTAMPLNSGRYRIDAKYLDIVSDPFGKKAQYLLIDTGADFKDTIGAEVTLYYGDPSDLHYLDVPLNGFPTVAGQYATYVPHQGEIFTVSIVPDYNTPAPAAAIPFLAGLVRRRRNRKH